MVNLRKITGDLTEKFMSTRTLKRVEASLSEDVFDIVKEVASKWGMTTKSYLSMVITRSAIEDQQKFQQINDHSDDPDEKFSLTIEEKKALRKLLDTPYSGPTLFDQIRASGSRFPYREVPDEEKL